MTYTGYCVDFPVLYSRFLLVISLICSSVHMSTPILQFIPHFPPSWAPLVAQLVKNPTCNAGDLHSISGLGRSPGEVKYSGLENAMDCIDHGVTKS